MLFGQFSEEAVEYLGPVFAGCGDVPFLVDVEDERKLIVHAFALNRGHAYFFRDFFPFFVLDQDVLGLGAHGGDNVHR